jgi:hypothetical protein
MSDWIDRVLSKLDRLRAADPEFRLFGADDHEYRCGPRLTPTWLAHLERLYRIELPDDYRRFLAEVGNGGVGPYYGLQRFGYLKTPEQAPLSFGVGVDRTRVRSDGCTVVREERYTPAGALADPFDEMFYSSMKTLAGANRFRLARPFPLTSPGLPPEDEDSESHLDYPTNAAVPDLGQSYWDEEGGPCIDGSLTLAHYGCGVYFLLVVNGPEKGTIWMDDRASGQGMGRFFDSFAPWYEAWLDDMLKESETLGRT